MAVIISGSMYLASASVDYPTNHARIGLQNLLKTATITAAYSGDFYPQNAIDDVTYDFWRPDEGGESITYEAVFDAAYEIDYFGIAAHDLGTQGASVALEYHNGVTWVSLVAETEILDDNTVMVLFSKTFTNRIRFIFQSPTVFSIGVLYIGKAFAFERPFFLGHRPLVLNRTTAIDSKITEKGLDVGRYIIKKGATTKIAVKNQTPTFIRNVFLPLMLEMRTRGFFFAWRPDTYPTDIAFCWSRENVKPKNNGRLEYMDLDFTVKAI